jgi:hypothetical protein
MGGKQRKLAPEKANTPNPSIRNSSRYDTVPLDQPLPVRIVIIGDRSVGIYFFWVHILYSSLSHSQKK